MTTALLAEFRDHETLGHALSLIKTDQYEAIDAFTPYPVEGLADAIGPLRSLIRPIMLAGGLAVAIFAFALQWYSASIAYPINSGGRPLNSWQVFLLVPFEVGIFTAALCGVIAILFSCALPQLHHPLFEIPGFERATQDRFFLLAAAKDASGASADLRAILERAGAVVVTEVRRQ